MENKLRLQYDENLDLITLDIVVKGQWLAASFEPENPMYSRLLEIYELQNGK
jgi:hypothetical protein